MENLRAYLNSLATDEQLAFCIRCKTSLGYLRKAISIGQRLGETLVINIELASGGLVRCDDLRPDVDWSFLLDWALLRSNKNKAAYGANRESIK